MGIDDLEMAEKSTKFYAESTTEWQLRLIVWEFSAPLRGAVVRVAAGVKGGLT